MKLDIGGAKLSRFMMLVCSGVLLSRVLGLVRDIVFAGTWGASEPFAAFVIAFTFPNLLRGLFGEGVFSAAFVPFFSAKLKKEGLEPARQAANRVITALLLAVSVLVLAVILLTWPLARFFTSELAQQALAQLRWLMPYGVLICAAVALGAVLNGLGNFTVPAYNPVILNLCLIIAALAVCPRLSAAPEIQVYGLAGAVLVAGLLQVCWAALACKLRKCGFKPVIDLHSAEVRRVAWLMAPALLGMGVVQLNTAVDRLLAGWLGSTSTTALYYSQRLVYLPVGLFGVAMSTVCLPAMSAAWADKDAEAVMAKLIYALRQVLFMALPATALLLALRLPVLQFLFGRGAFDYNAVMATDWAMLFYVPGIPFFVAAKIAVTPLYAAQDTRTPVKVSLVCLVLNLGLNLILMRFMSHGGLALATSISSAVGLLLLLTIVRRRFQACLILPLLRSGLRLGIAAATAWLVAGFMFKQCDFYLGFLPRFLLPVSLVIASMAGLAVYFLAAKILRAPEPGEFFRAFSAKYKL